MGLWEQEGYFPFERAWQFRLMLRVFSWWSNSHFNRKLFRWENVSLGHYKWIHYLFKSCCSNFNGWKPSCSVFWRNDKRHQIEGHKLVSICNFWIWEALHVGIRSTYRKCHWDSYSNWKLLKTLHIICFFKTKAGIFVRWYILRWFCMFLNQT